jgi:hypothetical protein
VKPGDLNPVHLAVAMRLDVYELWDFARNSSALFKEPRTISDGKKRRDIDPPTKRGKIILRLLHRFLQRHFPPHPAVHGGAKGHSCFSAARAHKGRRFVINRDISNCYPSILTDNLFDKLRIYGFRADVASILSRLLTVRGRVPQGSPTSADALNFFLFDADRGIDSACGAWSGRYTRTYDDMVISTNDPRSVARLSELLERHIVEHGLEVNEKKRAKSGPLRFNQRQLVHNIQTNSRRGVRIVEEQRNKAIACAEGFVQGARALTAESIVGLAARRASLHGWLNHCRQADLGPATHLKRLLDAGDRIIKRRLREQGLSANKGRWWLKTSLRNEPARLSGMLKSNKNRQIVSVG